MKYNLNCNVLEVNKKSFKNKENKEQAYFTLSVHQPGEGVAEIGCTGEVAELVTIGENNFLVELRGGKPKVVNLL